MPMITVHTNKQLTKEEKALVGRGLGERITLLPGKSEASLMLEIQDGQEMFFGAVRTPAPLWRCACSVSRPWRPSRPSHSRCAPCWKKWVSPAGMCT